VILEVDVQADAANAVAALTGVGDAAKGMASDVQAAASTSDAAAGSMDGLAAGADAVDSKMGAAAGSLGALAGGLEAAGFGGAATALQGLAVATDTASGAAGILALVTESQAAAWVAAKAQAVGHTIALGAQKAATVTSTAAQWLLNAALSANPLGLVIGLLVLMAGSLAIAYNKSETFRDIVGAAMDVVKGAIDKVKDAVDFVVTAVGGMDKGWSAVQTAVDNALTPAKVIIDGVKGAIDSVIDAVQSLIGWIGKVDFPDIHIPGLRTIAGGGFGGFGGNDNTGKDTVLLGGPQLIGVQLTVNGDTDPDAAAQRIIQTLSRYLERQGKSLVIT
jgi:hypothetical protein